MPRLELTCAADAVEPLGILASGRARTRALMKACWDLACILGSHHLFTSCDSAYRVSSITEFVRLIACEVVCLPTRRGSGGDDRTPSRSTLSAASSPLAPPASPSRTPPLQDWGALAAWCLDEHRNIKGLLGASTLVAVALRSRPCARSASQGFLAPQGPAPENLGARGISDRISPMVSPVGM